MPSCWWNSRFQTADAAVETPPSALFCCDAWPMAMAVDAAPGVGVGARIMLCPAGQWVVCAAQCVLSLAVKLCRACDQEYDSLYVVCAVCDGLLSMGQSCAAVACSLWPGQFSLCIVSGVGVCNSVWQLNCVVHVTGDREHDSVYVGCAACDGLLSMGQSRAAAAC